MSNSNGIISAPVSQADLKAVLGISTNSLAAACQSGNINEKAACKPSYISSYKPLTMEQRKESNYSTYIQQYRNPILLARDVVKGEAWRYSKPQAPYYRRLDFNGYNHNAQDWVDVSTRDTELTTNLSLSLTIEGNGDATSEYNPLMSLFELGFLEGLTIQDVNFGFILRKGGFTESMSDCYYIPLTGAQTIRDFNAVIPANVFDSVGTWYMMPVLTTATYEQGVRVSFSDINLTNGSWWAIPYSNILSMRVVAPVYPIDKFSATIFDKSEVTGDSTAFKVTVPSLILSITNGNSEPYDAVVRVTPSPNYIVGNINSGSFAAKTITVGAGATVNVEVVSSTVVWETVNNRALIDIELYVDGRYKTIERQLIWAGRE